MDSQNFKDDVKHVRTNDGVGKEKNKFLAIIVVFLVIIIVLAGIIIAILLNNKGKAEEKRAVLVTEENAEEVAEELFTELDEEPQLGYDYYTVTMEPVWNFSEGDKESKNAVVINVESNAAPVYVDVFLESDESHVLYKSPIIPLGGELRNIKLDEDLDAGTYACVAEFHLLGENQESVTTVRVGLTIVIDN